MEIDHILMAIIALGILGATAALFFPDPPELSYMTPENFSNYCSRYYEIDGHQALRPGCAPRDNPWVMRCFAISALTAVALVLKQSKSIAPPKGGGFRR